MTLTTNPTPNRQQSGRRAHRPNTHSEQDRLPFALLTSCHLIPDRALDAITSIANHCVFCIVQEIRVDDLEDPARCNLATKITGRSRNGTGGEASQTANRRCPRSSNWRGPSRDGNADRRANSHSQRQTPDTGAQVGVEASAAKGSGAAILVNGKAGIGGEHCQTADGISSQCAPKKRTGTKFCESECGCALSGEDGPGACDSKHRFISGRSAAPPIEQIGGYGESNSSSQSDIACISLAEGIASRVGEMIIELFRGES